MSKQQQRRRLAKIARHKKRRKRPGQGRHGTGHIGVRATFAGILADRANHAVGLMRERRRLRWESIASGLWRRCNGALKLTYTGHIARIAMAVAIVVAVMTLDHGQAVGAMAAIALFNPTARSVFALTGSYPVALYTSAQSAINAAGAAAGGDVRFRREATTITSSLTMASGVQLRGVSANFRDTTKGSVIRTSAPGDLAGLPMIDVTDTRYAAVRDIGFEPAGSDSTTNTTLGISDFTGADGHYAALLTVEGCHFRYFGGACIAVTGGVNYIMRNRGNDRGSHFIYLRNALGNGGYGSDSFIVFNESGNATGNGTDGGAGCTADGIRIEGGGSNTIIGNHMYNNRYGIALDGGTNGFYNRVEGNRCEKNDGPGIYVNAGGRSTLLGNHVFNNGSITATGKWGIALRGTTVGNHVIGNYIYNEPSYPGGGTKVTGVYQLDGNTSIGIQLSGGGSNNEIHNNVIRNMNTQGIHVDLETYSSVRGNRINFCGQEGISVGGTSTDIAIEGCTVTEAGAQTSSTYSGILVDGCNLVSIVGCTIRRGTINRTKYGIAVGTTATNTSIFACDLNGSGLAAPYNDQGTGTVIRATRGPTLENAGTATVANGTTSITVTHGLGFTPTARSITVVPTNNLGNATKFWISAVGATTFVINVDVDPGATTATFAWSGRQAL